MIYTYAIFTLERVGICSSIMYIKLLLFCDLNNCDWGNKLQYKVDTLHTLPALNYPFSLVHASLGRLVLRLGCTASCCTLIVVFSCTVVPSSLNSVVCWWKLHLPEVDVSKSWEWFLCGYVCTYICRPLYGLPKILVRNW